MKRRFKIVSLTSRTIATSTSPPVRLGLSQATQTVTCAREKAFLHEPKFSLFDIISEPYK